MFNVCPSCGDYRPDREIRAEVGLAVCPCGDVQTFSAGPLFIVGGPSATGKSTILNRIGRRTLPVVPLDGDILWLDAFRDGVDAYFELCLRLAKNVGMAGKPVLMFAAGLVVPENIESCVERRYFSEVHRLALVCQEEELGRRLRARPQWRGAGDEDFVATQVEFDTSIRKLAPTEGIELVDTSSISVDEASDRVIAWVRRRLDA